MKTKRLIGLFAATAFVLVNAMLFFSVPVAATTYATPPAASSSDTPIPTSGEIQIVSFNTDLNLGNGNIAEASEIRPGTYFDLLIKISDTRPEVVAGATSPNILKPVAVLNSSSFTRGRDMTSQSGYPDFRIEMGSNGTYIIEKDANGQNRVTYVMRMPLKYNGNGNSFACNISYEGLNTVPMQTVSLTLSMCVDNETESTSTIVRGTGFVLKSLSYGDDKINAGSTFDFAATLLATNGSYGVDNVTVEVVPAKEITLANGSGIFYVGNVKPNQAIPVNFQLVASAIAEEGSYTVTLNVKGVNANDGTEVTASMDISIPIIQPERFEIGNAMVPDYLTAGVDDGMGYVTVSLVNKGKGTVYNVSGEIVGEGLTTDEGNQFIGNIAAGTESSADFNLHASTPGEVKAQIVITYENARGEEKTITHDFTITVGEGGGDMGIDPFPIEPMPEEPTGGMPSWGWIIIGLVGLAVAGVVVVIVLRKRQAKKAAELEDDEDDDDEIV